MVLNGVAEYWAVWYGAGGEVWVEVAGGLI